MQGVVLSSSRLSVNIHYNTSVSLEDLTLVVKCELKLLYFVSEILEKGFKESKM